MKHLKKRILSSIVLYINTRNGVISKIIHIMRWNIFKLALHICVETLFSKIEFSTINLSPRNVNIINLIFQRFTPKYINQY